MGAVRKAMTKQYTNDGEELKLTWDMVVSQFENLIKFASRQQIENHVTDSMTSAEDLFQIGMIKLYDCWMKWCMGHNKDMDEFGAIFKKSLFRAMAKEGQSGMNKITCVDLEDSAMENMVSEDLTPEDNIDKMNLSESLERLYEALSSDISRGLLKELESPSERTLYEVLADIKRKEMLKSQGKRVNVPKDNTVRMKHIIRSLNITVKQYDIAMAEIREKARVIVEL